jgi:hypothetical protein
MLGGLVGAKRRAFLQHLACPSPLGLKLDVEDTEENADLSRCIVLFRDPKCN